MNTAGSAMLALCIALPATIFGGDHVGRDHDRNELLNRVQASTPIRSPDGSARVFGASTPRGQRLELLRFSEVLRSGFSRFTGIKGESLPFDLVVLDAATPEPLAYGVQRLDGVWRGVLEMTGDCMPTEEELATALCAMWFNLWRQTKGARLNSLPDWLSLGVGRRLLDVTRQTDADEIAVRWFNAELPLLDIMLEDESGFVASRPALASELAQWLFSHRHRQRLLEALGTTPETGRSWSATRIAWSLGAEDPRELDAEWDRWLLERSRRVMEPGRTTLAAIFRFRAALLLYPGESGIPLFEQSADAFGFRCLLIWREKPWAAHAARGRRQALYRLAAGRGPELQRIANRFGEFLDGMQEGRPDNELEHELLEAQTDLERLALRLASGGNDKLD